MSSHRTTPGFGNERYQFQIDGRGFGAAIRNTWEEAAADAVAAGYATWVGPNQIKLDSQQGAEIARIG